MSGETSQVVISPDGSVHTPISRLRLQPVRLLSTRMFVQDWRGEFKQHLDQHGNQRPAQQTAERRPVVNFSVTYDLSVTSQSQSFQSMFHTAVNAALSLYESEFTNNITVNITFAWGATSSNAVAENSFYYQTYSYAQIVSALKASGKSADDIAAYATLPASDPTGSGHAYALTTAQAEALGLSVGYTPPYDDFVTLGSGYAWTFDPNNRAVAGEFDAIGALEHEISEGVFGRIGSLGSASAGFGSGIYTPLDLFRYSAPGVHDYSNPGANDYFSIDGTHLLTEFNNHNQYGGDVSDWYPTIQGDSFGDAYHGVAGLVTPTDLRELDVLGWNLAQQNQVPVVTASNVSVTARQVLSASSLFSARDPDGDQLTMYAFQQMTTNPNSGHFAVNGVAVTPNTCIYLTAAQLAQTTFVAGTTTADIFVDAFDGTSWGTPAEFHVNPPVNSPPAVSASDVSVAVGQVLSGSSLFSASDSDGDQLTMYAFQQMTTSQNSGHFSINGAIVTPNTCIYLTSAQLAQTTFVAGSVSADVFVDAFDGTSWGTPAGFHVNPPVNPAPVVTTSNVSVTAGQVLSGSSLFNATDPDGDQLTMYAFQQMTTDPNSGHFSVAGVAVTPNTCVYLTPAQLAQTTFTAGSVSADVFVDAFDGTSWGTPAEFHVNPPTAATAGPSNGEFTISAKTELELFGASSANVSFAPAADGTLKLDASCKFTGNISGFGGQDSIDLSDIAFGARTTLGYTQNQNNTEGTLVVGDGVHTADLALFGSYIAGAFATSPDGHGGTLVSDPLPFAPASPLSLANPHG